MYDSRYVYGSRRTVVGVRYYVVVYVYVESRLKLELFELDGLRLVLRVRRYDCAGCDGDRRAGHGPRTGHLIGADGKAFRVRVRVRVGVSVSVSVRVRVSVSVSVRVRVSPLFVVFTISGGANCGIWVWWDEKYRKKGVFAACAFRMKFADDSS